MEQNKVMWGVIVVIIISAGILFLLAFFNTANAPVQTDPVVDTYKEEPKRTQGEQTFRTKSE